MAKISSGATEINGFIAVKNEKKDAKKTPPRKTNSTVGVKEESKTKKPTVTSVRDAKNSTTTNVGNVKKQLSTQSVTDKNKVITKKPIENKVPVKPQVPAASTKKVPQTKSTTSLSDNKAKVQTTKQAQQEKVNTNQKILPKKSINVEQKKTSNVEQKKATNIEQKKPTNVYKPNRPANIVEQKKTTNTEQKKTSNTEQRRINIEQRKQIDTKSLIKPANTTGKDVTKTQYKIPPRLNQNVKLNSDLKDSQQKKSTKPAISTAKPNNKYRVVDSSDKSGISNKQESKEEPLESAKETEKDDETPNKALVFSRQGTWVKESSDKKNTYNAHVDYESDFELETSISTSERTDAASKSQSLSQKVRKSNIQTNKSRLTSSQGKDVSDQNEINNGEESNITIVDENVPKLETIERTSDNLESLDNAGKLDEEAMNSVISAGEFPQLNEEQLYNDYDYDDDFEDYESDFEEYTESGLSVSSSEYSSTSDSYENSNDSLNDIETKTSKSASSSKVRVEEERKLDSGNYDLTTKLVLSEAVKQRQLHEIKEAISRENSIYQERSSLSNSMTLVSSSGTN